MISRSIVQRKLTMRSELDGKNVWSNFKQYSLEHLSCELVIADNAHPPWRKMEMFDAIVTDRRCFTFRHRATDMNCLSALWSSCWC